MFGSGLFAMRVVRPTCAQARDKCIILVNAIPMSTSAPVTDSLRACHVHSTRNTPTPASPTRTDAQSPDLRHLATCAVPYLRIATSLVLTVRLLLAETRSRQPAHYRHAGCRMPATLVAPEKLEGEFVGNGHLCAPACTSFRVLKACGGGVCVRPRCFHGRLPAWCPVYFFPCNIFSCYVSPPPLNGSYNNLLIFTTPDEDTIDCGCGCCGAKYLRRQQEPASISAVPAVVEMERSASPSASGEVPKPWKECIDPASKVAYYFNTETGKSTWKMPKAPAGAAAAELTAETHAVTPLKMVKVSY